MTAPDMRAPVEGNVDATSRRRRGLILGGAGLLLLFVPATLFLLVPSTFALLLVGTMVAGVMLLIVAFIVVPRKS